MVAGNLRSIGPIAVDYRSPQLRWTSEPTAHGIRSVEIEGVVELARAQQLSELINSPDAQTTVGDHTGALEYVYFDGDVVGPFKGWYLLESFEITADHQYAFSGFSPFSVSGAYLGDVIAGTGGDIDGGTPADSGTGVVDGGAP